MAYEQETRQGISGAAADSDTEPMEPGLLDALRFVYRQRRKFALRTCVLFGLGTLAFGYLYLTSPKIVTGTVGLSFRGIEKSEYPSGKRFTVEDFRRPGALTKALGDSAIPKDRVSLRDLIAHTYITPVIPGDIQSLWRKQAQAGTVQEEYFPSEFNIAIALNGLSDEERLKLFDALVKRYQEAVRYDQKSAKGFVNEADTDYDKLAGKYDLWDIPDLFRQTYKTLNTKLNSIIEESTQQPDASLQLALREVAKELDTWERTRLESLEALTYQGRLVKNRDTVTQRVQYHIHDLDIQIRQKSQEAAEGLKLLEVIEQPKTLVGNREGSPILDSSMVDKLLKNDYVGPVVAKISKLQEDAQALQADKARLEKQLFWLPQSTAGGPGTLPAGYRDLTTAISKEISAIIQKYNRILDDYLTVTITSLVITKQTPIVSRGGYSPGLVLPAIAFLSILLAIILMGIEHLFAKARAKENQGRQAAKQRSLQQ